ncbi:MAG: chromate resistance protein [Acidobacteria bacterium]|nr:chromate resistance protein [Acidobacteriota bacterium]
MTARPKTAGRAASAILAPPGARRWLLFVHQLPSHPSNLRVRTWRRLQQLGALPIKQAVYVLPDSPAAREDFEWLKTEVNAAGGDASVFSADHVDAWSDNGLIEEFRRSRQEAYSALAHDIEKVLKRTTSVRRPRGTRAPAARRLLEVFGERLTAIQGTDFFGSAGRDRVTTLLTQLKERASDPGRPTVSSKAAGPADPNRYRGRFWVTRPRPGVDRMASAWLIRRFIDPEARFGFAADRDAVREDAIPFDMFGVDFSHQGEGCTFETLCTVFAIQESAVARLAAIVHDLDLKDGRFGAAEAPTLGTLIDGLQLAYADDEALLAQGMALFDALYRAFERSARSPGPRPWARSRKRPASGSRKPARRRRVP